MLNTTKDFNANYALRDAVWNAKPKEGLYWLRNIPVMPKDKIAGLLQNASYAEVGTAVLEALTAGDPDAVLFKKIMPSALNFDVPLQKVQNNRYVLELFRGPTGAFKDVAARTLARYMEATREDRPLLTIAVATSGDTGGAVANAFHGLEGFRVIILYPEGMVSEIQEQQLTTLGDNIYAFKVNGPFDTCQKIVKDLINRQDEFGLGTVSTANSINIMRVLPQVTYYAWAIAQMAQQGHDVWGDPVNVVVPSGNMGNVTAAIIAKKMGFPIKSITIACNENDPVFRFLEGGDYEPRNTIETPSNAMDVGDPSNWERVMALYNGDRQAMLADGIRAARVSNEATYDAVRGVYEATQYLPCPHTAVGLVAARAFKAEDPVIVAATAHPGKFLPAMRQALKVATDAELPDVAREMDGWFGKPPVQLWPLDSANWEKEFKAWAQGLNVTQKNSGTELKL